MGNPESECAVDIEAKETSPVASSKADAALDFLQSGDSVSFSEVEEKALVRKIDWMIVPLMWAVYFLQYLDKILSS